MQFTTRYKLLTLLYKIRYTLYTTVYTIRYTLYTTVYTIRSVVFVANDALSTLLKTLCFCSDGWEANTCVVQ